jgi:hypothetical protein
MHSRKNTSNLKSSCLYSICSKFNAEWKIKLEEKRHFEFEEEKKARAKASEELSNLSAQREIKLNAKKDKNRTEESIYKEAINNDIASSHLWDRVTKLIDAAGGETADARKADIGRMRKLFIQLKSEPIGE